MGVGVKNLWKERKENIVTRKDIINHLLSPETQQLKKCCIWKNFKKLKEKGDNH